MAMIRFEQVSKNYGKVEAVKNLDFSVDRGVCFGFLGPNGAGKTTTIKMLTGILIPTGGRILIDGFDIQLEPDKAKQLIGFIPDKPFIYDKLTGAEFLDFILDIYRIGRKTAESKRRELLDIFSLTDWQNELVENYSHGMKQKLVITGVLIHNPRLMVIDEPMVGLDPHGHKIVKQLLREFCANGNTIFMSTHTLSVAQELCHRISIIDKGNIIATGNLAELRSQAHEESDQLERIFLKLTEPAE
jgi:ABC-2 type transport system ATP-binding protein